MISPSVEVNERGAVQQSLNLLGAIAAGIEDAIGSGANDITYLAGKQLGRRLAQDARPTDKLDEALSEVRRVLTKNDCLWHFEKFEATASAPADGEHQDDVVQLVFRDCMIRQALFHFGHAQRGSLCNMMYGFFAGALEMILGREANLEILHAGENACLKNLRLGRRKV